MLLCIADVLHQNDLNEINSKIEELDFIDGRATAGWSARLVKLNEQAAAGALLDAVRETIVSKVLDNAVFQMAARPKSLTPPIVSRYAPGKRYGAHVDDALMHGMRTDVSFTLFLAEPDRYAGGELVIESAAGEQAFKLAAGSMIVYPSTSLHRVEEVESGVRVAVVGWARSFVRSAEKREILFDLDTARRDLFAREGKTAAFDLLSRSSSNLLRMWADD